MRGPYLGCGRPPGLGSVSSHTSSCHVLCPCRSLTIRPALELQVWMGRGWNCEVSRVHRVPWGREHYRAPANGQAVFSSSCQELDSPDDAVGTIKRAPFLGLPLTEPTPDDNAQSCSPGEAQTWQARRNSGVGLGLGVTVVCAYRNPVCTSTWSWQPTIAAHCLGHPEATGGP